MFINLTIKIKWTSFFKIIDYQVSPKMKDKLSDNYLRNSMERDSQKMMLKQLVKLQKSGL